MKDLMGIDRARGKNRKVVMTLPDLLPAGDSYHVAKDGSSTRLWNPDWKNAATVGINSQFIDAVVTLTKQQEKVHSLTSALFTKYSPKGKDQPSVGVPVEKLLDKNIETIARG